MGKFFEGIPKKLFCLSLIITEFWGVLQSHLAVILSKIIAYGFKNNSPAMAIWIFILFLVIWEILEYMGDFLVEILGIHLTNNIYTIYFRKLYQTRPAVLLDTNNGYIAGILTQMIEIKKEMVYQIFLSILGTVYTMYALIFVSVYSVFLSIILFFIVVLGLTILILSNKMSRVKLEILTSSKENQTRLFMDCVNNISTVQKLRGFDFINSKSEIIKKENLVATRSFFSIFEFFMCIYKFSSYMVFPVCVGCAMFLNLSGNSEFIAYISILTIQLVHSVSSISKAVKGVTLWGISRDKIDVIISDQNKIIDCFDNYKINIIEIKDLTYTYKNSVTVIHVPYFIVNKGDFVCITGESGQGKTTILKILSGIIETPNVFVNECLVTKNLDLVYIAQDTEMLDMSLRDNLRLGNTSISDTELFNMLEEMGLKNWFATQKNGLDTLIGERGVRLPTGQRQRLNIARGLLIDKPVYLIDEPTSNMDERTEEKVTQLLRNKFKSKTVILVTHRNKLKRICNKEYVFENNQMIKNIDFRRRYYETIT